MGKRSDGKEEEISFDCLDNSDKAFPTHSLFTKGLRNSPRLVRTIIFILPTIKLTTLTFNQITILENRFLLTQLVV